MAATEVQKPDHAAPRRHFIFTEEHEALRESIHAFVDEGARAARGGVGGDDVPGLGLRGAWASSGFLGLSMPEAYGGQGGDYFCEPRARRGARRTRGSGGLSMGVAVHTDMATPPILQFGTEEQKQRYLVPAITGEKISCLGHHRARRRLRRLRHPHARRARRRRVGHQRLQDLHHQRPPGRLHRARDQDRPGRGLRRLHAVPRRHGPAGRRAREAAREARHARLRHRAAGLPGRARARRPPCSASSARASTTSCGSSRASG